MNFEGTYVAMVTPFTEDKKIDEEGFRSNINFLIDQGVNGLVAAGTTGESATLTHDEHQKVIDMMVDEVNGRVKLLPVLEAILLPKLLILLNLRMILMLMQHW